MTKRLIPLVVAIAGLGIAACGSDGPGPSSASSDSTLPTVPADGQGDGYTHPTGADEVVVSYAELGGFTTREYAFQQPPSLLISGDGRLLSPGAQIEIYPGPLLQAVQVRTITEAGIQEILAAANEAGLLADVDCTAETNIADASTATVMVSADGETWFHEAYALGFAGPDGVEPTSERQALLRFVTQLTDLEALVGSENLGEATLFEPTEYEIEAIAVDDLSAYGTDGIEATVEEWPADISVGLADASECTVVPATEVGQLLASANQLTFFEDAGVTYQVLARPALPGSQC